MNIHTFPPPGNDRSGPWGRIANTPLFPASVFGCLVVVVLGFVVTIYRTAIRFLSTTDVVSTQTVVADWLINYEGGFVRRGLFGSLALWIAGLTGCSPRLPLFVFVSACYTVMFTVSWILFRRLARPTPREAILLLSPVALMFPACHGIAGQRKEVALLAILSVGCLGSLAAVDTWRRALSWSAVYAIVTLGCDSVPFFLPLCLRLHLSATGRKPGNGTRLLAIAIPAFLMLALQLALTPRADLHAMCAAIDRLEPGAWYQQRIGDHYPNAIAWLQGTALDGVRGVISRYGAIWPAVKELLIGAIGLTPLWIGRRPQPVDTVRLPGDTMAALLTHPGVGLAGVAVLFLVANDWNRWFYIAASILTVTELRRLHAPPAPETAAEPVDKLPPWPVGT
ncbi:MAG: hypothetical protein EBR86_10255 [Planctomycetia bacterium]|nr:hypothetical protein [Planctomycetia bacterium]